MLAVILGLDHSPKECLPVVMMIFDPIRRHARNALGPLLGVAGVVYFGVHAMQGDRGLMAWAQVRQEIAKAEIAAQEISAEKADLEHRVALLRNDSLDLDMLEERVRLMLNLTRQDEKLISLPPLPAAASDATEPAQQ